MFSVFSSIYMPGSKPQRTGSSPSHSGMSSSQSSAVLVIAPRSGVSFEDFFICRFLVRILHARQEIFHFVAPGALLAALLLAWLCFGNVTSCGQIAKLPRDNHERDQDLVVRTIATGQAIPDVAKDSIGEGHILGRVEGGLLEMVVWAQCRRCGRLSWA